MATGREKVGENFIFFKVRDQGILRTVQGNFKFQESQGKVGEFLNFGRIPFGCGWYFIHFE